MASGRRRSSGKALSFWWAAISVERAEVNNSISRYMRRTMLSSIQFLASVVVVFSLVCLLAADSEAGHPRGGFGGGFGGYGRGFVGGYQSYGLGGPFEMPYAMGRIPTPPYFALHPPVHYSAAIPRTYGYSPFAYPGTYRTPELAAPPMEVMNPHVQPNVQVEPTNHLANAPVMVRNPFVGRESEADVEVARSND